MIGQGTEAAQEDELYWAPFQGLAPIPFHMPNTLLNHLGDGIMPSPLPYMVDHKDCIWIH